jgi:predicted PurR-regulated permease PerM
MKPLDLPQASRRPSITHIFVLVAGLYFARELLIPIALALLMTPILAPPIAWLERLKLGRTVAVLVVIALTCALLVVTTWFLTQQVTDLVAKFPQYKAQITAKIGSFRGGIIERATDAVKELEAGIENTSTRLPSTRPQEVRVVPHALGDFEALAGKLGFVLGPLGTLAVVLVIATFLLLQRGDLRDRVVHLIGHSHVNLTTQAMNEITTRVGNYLLMQATLNSVHGTVVGLGLFLLGVPNALVWGILAGLLRFIPYFGALVATVMPVALSLAAFDGWERSLVVAGFLIAVELVTSNILEPWLYGSSAGVSSQLAWSSRRR